MQQGSLRDLSVAESLFTGNPYVFCQSEVNWLGLTTGMFPLKVVQAHSYCNTQYTIAQCCADILIMFSGQCKFHERFLSASKFLFPLVDFIAIGLCKLVGGRNITVSL